MVGSCRELIFNENVSSIVNLETNELEKNSPPENLSTKKSIIIVNNDYLNSYDNIGYEVNDEEISLKLNYQKRFAEVPLTSNTFPTSNFPTKEYPSNDLPINRSATDSPQYGEEAIEFSLLFTEETEADKVNKQINLATKDFLFSCKKGFGSLHLDQNQSESLKYKENQHKIIDNKKSPSGSISIRNEFEAMKNSLWNTCQDTKNVYKDSDKESNKNNLNSIKTNNVENNSFLEIKDDRTNCFSGVNSQIIATSHSLNKFSTCVILDNGSGSIKCGISSLDSPLVIPSLVGRSNYTKVLPGALKSEWIGNDAQLHRGILKLSHPIDRGIIKDWIDMEKVWEYAFEVGGIYPEEHPIFICCAPSISKKQQECIMEIMLEKYQSPAFYIAPQAVMCLYGCGRISGIVLDVGDHVAHSSPVYEGHVIGHSSQLLELGGKDVSNALKTLLSVEGKLFSSCADLEICREIKEAHCFVKRKQTKICERLSEAISYQLPDGRFISLDSERHEAPEILFRPDLIGLEGPGIHNLITKGILKTDKDLKELLSSNIILAGGTTKLVGLEERLLDELAATEMLQNLKITKPVDTTTCAWDGAKVITSLSIMNQMWITAEEYMDYGKNILHTKCF